MNRASFNKIKRQILSHVRVVRGVLLAILFIIVCLLGILIYRGVSKSIVGENIGLMRDFIFPSTDRISTNYGRINILILGTAGPGRGVTDANMTDTMILASVSTTGHKITLVSIPRDIWMPDLKDKINSAYYYGGLVLAKSSVEEVLGQQVDYAVTVDFNAFKEVVNALGGIQVTVKNSFTDSQYPITGKENDNCNGDPAFACRYMTVAFTQGLQTMNGDKALEFVRSRHAIGDEGSDIAREARQQLVISAIMKKALTPQIFTNLAIDRKMLDIVSQSVTTDLKPSEIATLARYVISDRANMKSYTIPDNLLYHPANEYKYFNSLYTHAWVYIPTSKDGTWSDLQSWVKSVLP